jgi:hypothetical protein
MIGLFVEGEVRKTLHRLNKVFFEGDHVQGVEYPTD